MFNFSIFLEAVEVADTMVDEYHIIVMLLVFILKNCSAELFKD